MNLNDDFTFDYHQPSEYHFSLDSVLLPKLVAQNYEQIPKSQLESMNVLDLCSGTGIMGLEFSYYLKDILKIDFLEVQEVYRDYFLKNKEMVAPGKENFKFLCLNYEQMILDKSFHNSYDLILCNPPYFFKDEGILSPSEFKNRCRFFLDSSFENLIKAIGFSLKIGGEAYVLARPGHDHNRGPVEMVKKILVRSFTEEFQISASFALRNVISINIKKLL